MCNAQVVAQAQRGAARGPCSVSRARALLVAIRALLALNGGRPVARAGDNSNAGREGSAHAEVVRADP